MKKLGPGQHFLHGKSMGKYFIAQGQVTLKWMIQPGPNSNWSEMFWLSWIPASLKKLRSKMKKLGPGQHFLHCKSMGKYFIAQGQVTLKKMIQPGPNSNWSEMFWLSWIPASLKKLRSKMKKLGPGQHFLHCKSMGKYFIAQGQVTLKKMIQPGPNSNWSEMFWLSWIPASLKKLRSKMKKLGPGQHFLHCKSMGKYFIAQGQVTL